MKVLGISALFHDASVCMIENEKLLFAAHAERYSRQKNDLYLNQTIINEALSFGNPDVIAWYEKPFNKKLRQAYASQWKDFFLLNELPRNYLKQFGLHKYPIRYINHHEAHAAAGFFTSQFDNCCVIVADAIGEWTTFSIGEFVDNKFYCKKSIIYPHSLGLLYSAFTQRCDLKPNEEEYILMGMASYGEPKYVDDISNDFIELNTSDFDFRLKMNVHKGIGKWNPQADLMDLAASIQAVTERILLEAVKYTAREFSSENLILMGGVSLNCVANEKIARFWMDKTHNNGNIWIMPNPGDSGTCIGAASSVLGKKVHWKNPYLGYDIKRSFEHDNIIKALLNKEVIAVANGKAEFGPRALGNRSILSDPRGIHMKDKVNSIKRRQKFRPFAPIIMEDKASDFFDMYIPESPYMQFTFPCKAPDEYSAIVHVDGSSRVQTVNENDNSNIYNLLLDFYERTGCPMLLNTSMNIKGEPLVNTWDDALRFNQNTKVQIF